MTAVGTVTEQDQVETRDDLLIGNEWVRAGGDTVLAVVNPATEQVVGRIREASGEDVDRAVEAARTAFDTGPWADWSAEQRATVLEAIADRLESRLDRIRDLQVSEGGMPLSFSQYSRGLSLAMLRYYAQQARGFAYRVDRPRADGGTTAIVREPVGVAALITPWNGPLAVACLKLGPALAAGCTVVIKPAPEVPLSTYLLADVVHELVAEGIMPAGVVNLVAGGREVGERLVTHPGVDKISFTGSTAIGEKIMAEAAKRMARVTFELGGKSAAIVCDDIPLDQVLPTLIPGGCGNTGQMCFGLTRVLVSEKRHDEFVAAMAAALQSIKVGDPSDPDTEMGPLAMERQLQRVLGYIDIARQEGARIVTGGGRPKGLEQGYFVEPTLLTGVASGSRVAQEEIFGPVISVITYKDIDDAVRIANDSVYGLSGAVYTTDVEAGTSIARRVRTGTMSVNAAVFDFTVPFGGYKSSGLGREGGPEGIDPYLEYKSIHLPA
ncbi:aldehyde dehydrogenase [Nocardia sp. NPDC052278]|uniref:aldehyde dehydrogenase n=1 Tax=unclassified Nocardia TaxID=2637762 RepID=UPI0036A325F6